MNVAPIPRLLERLSFSVRALMHKTLHLRKRPFAICALLAAVFLHDVHAGEFPVPGAVLNGDLTQGGLIVGTTESDSRVELDGKAVRVSKDGVFLLGFGRDAKPKWSLAITHPNGKVFESEIRIAAREYDIQRIDGLPPSKVTPSQRDLSRIQEDVRVIRKARTIDDPRTDFLETFDWPVLGVITGIYGSQRILNGEPRRPHFGIDIHATKGTAVKAPASGVVTVAHPDMFFSGATLVIDHGHGLSSAFLHLDEILVDEGDSVKKGDALATVGSSGRSTGAHLDWRINWFSQRLDPALIAGEMPAAQ